MLLKPLPAMLFSFLLLNACLASRGQDQSLQSQHVRATFGPLGLTSITQIGGATHALQDAWSLTIDQDHLESKDSKPSVRARDSQMVYEYRLHGYTIQVAYRLEPDWTFVSKELTVVQAPRSQYTVHALTPMTLGLKDEVTGTRVPTSNTPHLAKTIEETRQTFPARDFGLFLRFGAEQKDGLMLLVKNPFLQTTHTPHAASAQYSPEFPWDQAWGPFRSDAALLGPYRLTGVSLPKQMLLEWKLSSAPLPLDGLDRGEIAAFTECVRSMLIAPAKKPISVEVGWTLNDYQVDVATEGGKQEYHRIIDATAELGLSTLLFAPTNSSLALRKDDTDSWHWEHTLWLNLGQKIRKGEWDPATSPIPQDVAAMLAYAKSKNVGLLAYVYPSVPFSQDPSWLVKGSGAYDPTLSFATMSSRAYQDLLLRDLLAFKRRTGIAGYSFDYAFLDFAGSSSYAQWAGWRRVMEELKRAEPNIVIDGRQSYQLYGPWGWLAGNYPHPTGQDEQPESFKPFPDLHFDRVSADRARYVNYWYRNYQFAPSEIVPGYATHQTERSRNLSDGSQAQAQPERAEEVHTAYRVRDWDHLGFRYSFLSSIATGGWNNVVDMIPARDEEEYKHFSNADKQWIHDWVEWTSTQKELLRHTRTILQQPAMGKLDGTSAIVGDHGFVFLFNPNYRALKDSFRLDGNIGLTSGSKFVLREVYPQRGMLWGKAGEGLWTLGDTVPLALDGTSATVLEVVPAPAAQSIAVFNAAQIDGQMPEAGVNESSLTLTKIAGEPGTHTEVGVLLAGAQKLRSVTVNGRQMPFQQRGSYVEVPVSFRGERFSKAQQLELERNTNGSFSSTFTVPQRVFTQLGDRHKAWPIPWTTEDYETTWLAPERLLLYLQAAEATDSMAAEVFVDGAPVAAKRAYTSTRVHSEAFVGLYVDLSTLKPGVPHTLRVQLSGVDDTKFQGAFFENVEPQFTTEVVSSKP